VVLANAGVAAEKIPSLVQIGDAVGYLTSAAASEVGLRKGIPIVACPGDVPAAFIAVGAQPDVVFANLGTTTVVCCLVAHPAAREGFTHEILDRGRRSLETGFGGGGVTFDWLSRLFGMTQEILEHEAEAAAPSSVKVEPELLSPWGAQPRGLIGDIGVTDGRSEIVQAAYRSVALRVIELASALEAIAGPKDRLLLGGGGASSDLLSHEIGRLWKGSLQRFSERELAAEGAAMTASIALAQAPIVRHVAQ
jgi:sugar (pentulose or hexulose) kinase